MKIAASFWHFQEMEDTGVSDNLGLSGLPRRLREESLALL